MTEKHLRQLASVIENMSSSVIIMDHSHRIVYVNPATLRMLGYREEEMLGRLSAEIFEGVPGNPADLSGTIAREAKNGLWEGEIVDRRKSGEIFPVFLRMCIIRNEKGQVMGYAGISEDITRRKQLEEDLIQKEKLSALGELISGIAHELNNPLTGVLGYAEIIQQYDCPAELRDDLQRLYKEALRCQYLVRNLLTFSRRPALHRARADINLVIKISIELKAHQFKADQVRVSTSLDARIPEAMLDSNQMQQVFVNILNNAHHALAEKGGERRITVSSRLRDGSIEVAIGNNGTHIPPDRMEKIFIPFFSTKEFGQGTGLGLSIAQGIVKDHGGEIVVESMEGHDTAFTVKLPLVRPPEA
jgi:two-component system NtrC family sensor kinase